MLFIGNLLMLDLLSGSLQQGNHWRAVVNMLGKCWRILRQLFSHDSTSLGLFLFLNIVMAGLLMGKWSLAELRHQLAKMPVVFKGRDIIGRDGVVRYFMVRGFMLGNLMMRGILL